MSQAGSEHTPNSSRSVTPFVFEGHAVRVVTIDGEPWFVLADVCRVLDISQSHRAADRLDDDEKTKVDLGCISATGAKINDLGVGSGNNEAWTINESGLYSLVLTSRKDDAKRFKKWITAEVLPSIRRTGGYGRDPMAVLEDPAALRGLLLTYSERVLALEAENAELAPKADALDRIATADGCMCLTAAAKALQVRPKDLLSYMREHRWIYRRVGGRLLGYQDKTNAGYLVHKVTEISMPDGMPKICEQVLVTPKGLSKLSTLVPSLVS